MEVIEMQNIAGNNCFGVKKTVGRPNGDTTVSVMYYQQTSNSVYHRATVGTNNDPIVFAPTFEELYPS